MPIQAKPEIAVSDTDIQRSFRLGWRFAQLYLKPRRATTDDPYELPGHQRDDQIFGELSVLSEDNYAALILRQMIHDIKLLLTEWTSGDGAAKLSAFEDNMQSEMAGSAKRVTIRSTYRKFRIDVGARDARLGEAADLGCMLADTVSNENASDTAIPYQQRFAVGRLGDLYGWLEDLHESFPTHASDAVRGSLQCWQQWVSTNPNPADNGQVSSALTRQGDRWRRILSGEILADDLLAAEDYKQAVFDYLGRTARQARAFAVRYWWAALGVVLATGGILWAIVEFGRPGAASIAAIIATGAGALGISWKTVGSTLGKVAALAEKPLWNAEVLEAITLATFIPPVQMKDRDKVALRKNSRKLVQTPAPPRELTAPQPPTEAA